MWVDLPPQGGTRLDSLTFLRAFLARWLVFMIVVALVLIAVGPGWTKILAVVVVVTGVLNLLSVHAKLKRERARTSHLDGG